MTTKPSSEFFTQLEKFQDSLVLVQLSSICAKTKLPTSKALPVLGTAAFQLYRLFGKCNTGYVNIYTERSVDGRLKLGSK
jgi:hypothetical protein